jgi:hypothetical protein
MYATSTSEANSGQLLKIPRETRISRAISAYDGSIDVDLWLNLVTTTRSVTKKVEKVITGDRDIAFKYLYQIGLPGDLLTCGLIAGKIRAMCAITLLRELYFNAKNNLYADEIAFHRDVCALNQFFHLIPHDGLFGKELKLIIDECEEFEKFSTTIVKHFMPVNNFVTSNRILKGRVKRSMYNEFYQVLRNRRDEPDFILNYCIGFLDRLFYMDARNPYWNESTCQKPLRHMLRLFAKVISDDYEFVKEYFPRGINQFLAKQQHFLEPIFTNYATRIIYQAAMNKMTLARIKDFLFEFQFEMDINIYIHPTMFRVIYNDMKHHDLSWAQEHSDEIITVSLS